MALVALRSNAKKGDSVFVTVSSSDKHSSELLVCVYKVVECRATCFACIISAKRLLPRDVLSTYNERCPQFRRLRRLWSALEKPPRIVSQCWVFVSHAFQIGRATSVLIDSSRRNCVSLVIFVAASILQESESTPISHCFRCKSRSMREREWRAHVMFAGSVAGATQVMFGCPVEIVKVRLQTLQCKNFA